MIKLATFSQTTLIAKLIAQAFVQFNPLTKACHISLLEFEAYVQPIVRRAIEQGIALIAVANQKVVGALIAIDKQPQTDNEISSALQTYQGFYKLLHQPLTEFKSDKKILYAEYLALHPDYYGQQLAIQLNNLLIQKAKSAGYQFLLGEFSNSCHFHQFKREHGDRLMVLNELAFQPLIALAGQAYLTLLEL